MAPFNLLDLLILVLLGYFVWSGYEQGLLLGVLNLIRTLAAFFLSVLYYPKVGDFLASYFHLAKPVGQILGFVLILLVVEIVLGFLLNKLHRNVIKFLLKFRLLFIIDKFLGGITIFNNWVSSNYNFYHVAFNFAFRGFF